MPMLHVVALVVTGLAFVYLLIALFKPELFD